MEPYFKKQEFVKGGVKYRYIEYQDDVIWEKSLLRIDTNVLHTIFQPFWKASEEKPVILFRGRNDDRNHTIGHYGGYIETVCPETIMNQIWYYDE